MDNQGSARGAAGTPRGMTDEDRFYHGDTPELLEEAEQLVREAERGEDLKALFRALTLVSSAGINCGQPDKAIVAFSRKLAMCRRDPDRFPEDHAIRWEYKWMASRIADFPGVTRQSIEEGGDRMEACYIRGGDNLRAVCNTRAWMSMKLGEPRRAQEWIDRRDALSREGSYECPSSEMNDAFCVLRAQDRDAEAVALVQPAFDGRIKVCQACGMPRILAGLLLPCLRLGRHDDAVRYHRWSYPLVERRRTYLHEMADHLEFLGLAAGLPHALQALGTGLPLALETSSPFIRWAFFQAAAPLARRLRASGPAPVRISLPQGVDVPAADGEARARDLADWIHRQVEDLARTFDRRNGNRWFQDRLDRAAALDRYRCELL